MSRNNFLLCGVDSESESLADQVASSLLDVVHLWPLAVRATSVAARPYEA
jgi:hypothetical protein